MSWLGNLFLSFLTFIFNHMIPEKKREALGNLRAVQRELEANNIDYNEDFFKDILPNGGKKGVINVFYHNLVYDMPSEKEVSLKNVFGRSYYIVGESGCGKSSILRNDYQNHSLSFFNKRFPYIHPINRLTVFSLYYSAKKLKELDDDKITFIESNLKIYTFHHIILYLDGLDELGDKLNSVKINQIIRFIEVLKIAKKFELKIACRKNYFYKHSCKEKIFDRARIQKGYDELEIKYWNSTALEKVSKKLFSNKNFKKTINNLSQEKYNNAKAWIKDFSNTLKTKKGDVFKDGPSVSVDKCLINSPLILMLFLYVNIFTDSSISNGISKYELYETFIYSLGKTNGASDNELEDEKEKISKIAFDNYPMEINSKNQKRLKNNSDGIVKGLTYLYSLIKNFRENDGEISFVHFSFYDYFVAYYYKMIMKEKNNNLGTMIYVLGAEYSNEISDFITESLDKEKEAYGIAKNMCDVYRKIINNTSGNSYSTRECFLAKKEIAFRLGRFRYNSLEERNDISTFLKDVYYNDNQTFKGDNDPIIHLAMLKRWIAIAGSLLNTKDGEEIEIDYIKKMICYSHTNNVEDLANRSQTLVFYGDVKNKSGLDFRDLKEGTSCSISIRKRINRLREINDENDNTLLAKNFNPRDKELKYYCFRAFDLSTIYCLLRFHKIENDILVKELGKGEHPMKISDIKVLFEGANPKREQLLIALKDALSQDVLPDRIKLD